MTGIYVIALVISLILSALVIGPIIISYDNKKRGEADNKKMSPLGDIKSVKWEDPKV